MDGMTKLPHKLSELARVALDDVVACEREPSRFTVEMNEAYCAPGEGPDGTCWVCAAGAVMVQRLGRGVSEGEAFPHSFDNHNRDALLAINQLRMGAVGAALARLGRSDEELGHGSHELDREMPEYESSGADWHSAMEILIDDLVEAGL